MKKLYVIIVFLLISLISTSISFAGNCQDPVGKAFITGTCQDQMIIEFLVQPPPASPWHSPNPCNAGEVIVTVVNPDGEDAVFYWFYSWDYTTCCATLFYEEGNPLWWLEIIDGVMRINDHPILVEMDD